MNSACYWPLASRWAPLTVYVLLDVLKSLMFPTWNIQILRTWDSDSYIEAVSLWNNILPSNSLCHSIHELDWGISMWYWLEMFPLETFIIFNKHLVSDWDPELKWQLHFVHRTRLTCWGLCLQRCQLPKLPVKKCCLTILQKFLASWILPPCILASFNEVGTWLPKV